MKAVISILLAIFPIVASAQVQGTSRDLADRMDRISFNLLGLPYAKEGPLGEGANAPFDRDPLIRWDRFDCTTYVETVMAAALSGQRRTEILPMLNRIRYKDAVVSYQTRNHMAGIDWIGNNTRAGFLRDITRSVAPQYTKIAETLIEKDNWFRKRNNDDLDGVPDAEKPARLRELNALGDLFGKQTERVPYLDKHAIDAHPEIVQRIPHGSVVNIVRPNWDLVSAIGTHLNISHQGFAFHRDGVVYFRNAKLNATVMEVPLLDYVRNTLSSPTVGGINVLSVHQPN